MESDLYAQQLGRQGVAASTEILTEKGKYVVSQCASFLPERIRTIWDGKMTWRSIYKARLLPQPLGICFSTATRRVTVTPLLPVLTKVDDGAVWKPADSLKIDDQVMVCDDLGSCAWWEPVKDLDYEATVMWNFTLSSPHVGFFNGILLHH